MGCLATPGCAGVEGRLMWDSVHRHGQKQKYYAHTREADLWRAVKSGEKGYTTAKGTEDGIMINVSAVEGTNIKNDYLTPVMAIAVLGVFGAFLLFYFVCCFIPLYCGCFDILPQINSKLSEYDGLSCPPLPQPRKQCRSLQ